MYLTAYLLTFCIIGIMFTAKHKPELSELGCHFHGWLVISVYLSWLLVAHLSEAPRRRLVVTVDSARIQEETTDDSAWFYNVLGV